MLQNGLKNLLGLEHQLEYVDYGKENLVHADMSPDDFSKSMQDRGESFWTMFFRLMGEGISKQAKYESQGKSFDADLLLALFDKDRAPRLKRIMAEQFEDLEATMAAFNGPDGSTIITERNKVALEGSDSTIGRRKEADRHFLRRRPLARHGPAADQGFQLQTHRRALADRLEPGGSPNTGCCSQSR